MEGDRLEILLAHERIEALRAHGRALRDDGTMPNLDAVLRKHMEIKKGTLISKEWPGQGFLNAKVIKLVTLQSELYPGKNVPGFKVRYELDGGEEDYEDDEIRKWVMVNNDPARKAIVDDLQKGYKYLEYRLAAPPLCEARYDCSHMYEMMRLVRAFDPEFATTHSIDVAWVENMAKIKPISANSLIEGMKSELPLFLAAARGALFDSQDIEKYSTEVLSWWQTNGKKIPTWAKAARIIFAMSPNSAACERVFSLLASMFTDEQHGSLADQMQAALMLKYNKRVVG